jgi:hypothetical protein
LALAERCPEVFLAKSGAGPSTHARGRVEAGRAERLPLGVAVLVIAGISAGLWFGIARLIAALF